MREDGLDPSECNAEPEASPDGVDDTQILWMLSLTPTERLEVLQDFGPGRFAGPAADSSAEVKGEVRSGRLERSPQAPSAASTPTILFAKSVRNLREFSRQ